METSRPLVDPTVVAPVPYAPPLIPWEPARRWRQVPQSWSDDGVPVHHPRVPSLPGNLLHALEARLAYVPTRRLTDRLHRDSPFDLIHAHFIFPDGVMAARLGERYGVPVVTTEHSLWSPWLDEHPSVRAQVNRAVSRLAAITVVSDTVGRTVQNVLDRPVPVRSLPNVVDDAVFSPGPRPGHHEGGRLLFVGAVRHVKGLDVLVRALADLGSSRPDLRLDVVGEPFFRGYRRDERRVRELVDDLGLEDRVRFVGAAEPAEVAEAMRRAAALVVPSRRESFSAVAVEALACGTPVVATRCGGPEEILTEETGVLVPSEDPEALAAGIEEVLSRRDEFEAQVLRTRALEISGPRAVRGRIEEIYRDVLSGDARA